MKAKLFYLFIIFFTVSCFNLFAQKNQPNIILILADDLGFECIGANGGTSYQTPNIDKLAAQGVRFENCHSQPLCTPTRVQLMTGQYNVRNYKNFGTLRHDQTSFANLLKEAGYKTAIAGKWQLGKEKDSPQHFGFEASCLWQQLLGNKDEEGHDTRYSNPVLEFNGEVREFATGEYAPDIANDFICDFIKKNKNTSFFAYYPMILAHCPFVPTPDSEDWDPANRGSLTYKGDPKYFPEMVTYMDKLVGKIVAKVEELGLSENTLIIFTGDNGTDQPIVSMLRGTKYPGGKGSTKDNGTHVPLIIRWDKTIKAGSKCNDLIDFSDFLPTICDAAKVSVPANLKIDGVSFLPQLQGKKGNPREWIYSWYSRDGKMDELTEFARNKNYKLYSNGQFFNVQDDFYETKPGSAEKLNAEEKNSYNLLIEALKKYENIRKKEN